MFSYVFELDVALRQTMRMAEAEKSSCLKAGKTAVGKHKMSRVPYKDVLHGRFAPQC